MYVVVTVGLRSTFGANCTTLQQNIILKDRRILSNRAFTHNITILLSNTAVILLMLT